MTILELREKRAKAWEAAKAFLDSHRNEKGVLSAEDDAAYTRMEQEITDLGKEIARMERQEAFERELSQPVNQPLTGRPASGGAGKEKTGRASEEYRTNFWNAMRSKVALPGVVNALEEGTDSEGGYLVPDEYERTLVEALEEENVFRQLANVIRTSSRDRKIPVVATKGTASWIDEEGAYTESDDSFGQVSIITADELMDLFYSLKSPYRKKAVWVLNDSTIKAVRKLKDSTGQYLWQPSLMAGTPDTLLGRPVKTSAYMPVIAAGAKTIAFGDFSYYWIADRQGRSFKRLNELYAANGQVGFLGSQRVDGKLVLSAAVKVLAQKSGSSS